MPTLSWDEALQSRTAAQQKRELPHWRQGSLAQTLQAKGTNQTLRNFGGNDYLGLSHHPALLKATQEAAELLGVGAGASRLLAGQSDLHLQLEAALNQMLGTEASLVFPTGYQANVGLMQALCDPASFVVWDRLCHASLIDGIKLSGAKWKRYRHRDVEHCERLLKQARQKGGTRQTLIIVTDSLFSMDGDTAPLNDLVQVAARYDAWLVVDEAHATGLYGEQRSSGLAEACGIELYPGLIRMGTFSKALGSLGGFVGGSQALIDGLLNFARGFIYTTALPAPVTAANLASLSVIKNEPHHNVQLWRQANQVYEAMANCDFWHNKLMSETASPIIPLKAGTAEQALRWQRQLETLGFYVPAIRPPSVPEGEARLRLSLSAAHCDDTIAALLTAMRTLEKPLSALA